MTSLPHGRILRIATRRSPLALWQAHYIAGLLEQAGATTEIVPLVSSGDVDPRPVDDMIPTNGVRQTGVFTKRIQEAVLAGEADLAVHSLKDLPTESDPRLLLAAVPVRESVHDCLISTAGFSLEELPEGARVGTGSRRRIAQLLNRRPDLDPQPLRGNLQTRLEKLQLGAYDAIVLAEAGLLRLELDVVRQALPLEVMLPAPGQGALAIEVRSADQESADWVATIEDPVARACVTAERVLLAGLHGGCLAPIAALATINHRTLELTVRVLSSEGDRKLEWRRQTMLDRENWVFAATALAEIACDELIAAGAREMIQESRAPS